MFAFFNSVVVNARGATAWRRDAPLDDLADKSGIGDWKMPDFKAGRAYAASQGWLIVEDYAVTLTTAGLAAARGRSGRKWARWVRKEAVRTGLSPATGEMIKIGEVITAKQPATGDHQTVWVCPTPGMLLIAPNRPQSPLGDSRKD
jgi:hypothetical protein